MLFSSKPRFLQITSYPLPRDLTNPLYIFPYSRSAAVGSSREIRSSWEQGNHLHGFQIHPSVLLKSEPIFELSYSSPNKNRKFPQQYQKFMNLGQKEQTISPVVLDVKIKQDSRFGDLIFGSVRQNAYCRFLDLPEK
jgi:hypothetical protein